MTVQAIYAPITYQGDGSTTAFAFTWEFQVNTDLIVTTTVAATGVTMLLVLGTNYTVTPSPTAETQPNGTVITMAPLPVGTSITIARAPNIDQLSTWVENYSNPAKLYENAIDKVTMVLQDQAYQISTIDTGGGGSGIVTTAVFVVAAIGLTQSVTVNTVGTLVVGNTVQISNVATTIIGQITGIAGTVLTVQTLTIPAGAAGQSVAIGTPVQLGSVSGQTTIQSEDATVAATTTSTLSFLGTKPTGSTVGLPMIDLFIDSSSGGIIGVRGAINPPIGPGGVIISTGGNVFWSTPVTANTVFGFDGSTTSFLKVNLSMLSATGTRNANTILRGDNTFGGAIPESLATGANPPPTSGQVPTYNGAGTWLWATPSGGGGLPGGGTTAQLLIGPGTWATGLIKPTPGTLFTLATTSTSQLFKFNGSGLGLQLSMDSSRGGDDAGQTFLVVGAIHSGTVSLIDAAPSYNTFPVEGAAFQGIMRAGGVRTTHGPWQYDFTLNNPGAAVTVDLANGAYQRHTGIANNVTITLVDNTPPPTVGGWQFCSELTLEINTPGAFLYTWPGSITWANGASAPTLSTTGINIIKFIRRQGLAQWIGSVVNSAGSGGTYTNAQARDAVGLLMSATATITPVYVSNTSFQFNVNALSIGNTQLAGGIAASKIAGFPSDATKFLNGGGGWTTPVGASTNNAPYNVRLAPYLATGNGSTDDTAAIQAAINNAAAAGGGTVYFPAGTYKITASLTMANGVNLQGEGVARRDPAVFPTYIPTKIIWGGAGGATMMSITGIIGGMSWRDIHFDGASLAAIGWLFESVTFSNFTHCEIVNCTAYGIKIAVPTGSSNDMTSNLFSNISINVAASGTGIYMSSTGAGANGCHNTFSQIWIVHGNRAIELGWCDNNMFNQIFCFRAAGTNYDVYLRGDFPVAGVGALANRFYQLEGETEAEHTTAGNPFFNEIYGYDQSNGQRSPLIHTSAILTMFGTAVVAETISGHSNFASVNLTTGQSICFNPPSAANTGVYIVYDGTNLKATKNGGNTFTTIV